DVILALEIDGQQFESGSPSTTRMRAGMPASPQFAVFASRCCLTEGFRTPGPQCARIDHHGQHPKPFTAGTDRATERAASCVQIRPRELLVNDVSGRLTIFTSGPSRVFEVIVSRIRE